MKGWIKLKSKKILGLLLVITLLSASVFGSINVFAANVTTNVALESYMPPVKTLFVDDDFQNRSVGEVVTTIAENKAPYDKQTIGIDTTKPINAAQVNNTSNIYVDYTTAYGRIDCCNKIISTSTPNNLVISFKANIEDAASNAYLLLRFGSKNPAKAFMFQKSSNGTMLIKKYKNNDASSTDSIKAGISAVNGWIDIAMVLEKSDDSAVLKKFFVNGSDVDITGKTVEFPADCNWWKASTTSGETVTAINIQSSAVNLKVDDILIYEPQTVYFKDVTQTGLTIVNDSSSEPVTGNLFLALYDTDGNLLTANPYGSDVTVAAGESKTINAPTGSITDLTGVAKAKIFYWNGTTLAPICYAAEKSISIS